MKKHLVACLAFAAELLSIALFLVAVIGLFRGDWPMVAWGFVGSYAAQVVLGLVARRLARKEVA